MDPPSKRDPLKDLASPTVPGDGITVAKLSEEPLATEGEATPGPDDYNPHEELEDREYQQRTLPRSERSELSLEEAALGEPDPFDGPLFDIPFAPEPDEKPRRDALSFELPGWLE